ncbi:hypothetical protein LENED_001360 [Lentinula edodes]|uniref:Uncharacterized protein n=1 Tax=Lentinula edodes TaxID=5353 RepID=A0A1Q3DY00_LENED|nr:hypothetical protein LENED_001360 [Lentinula edodes]
MATTLIRSYLSRHRVEAPKLTLFGRSLLLLTCEILANALCWTAAGVMFGRTKETKSILGLAMLAWTLGLRHALDADHISAIDNATRGFIAMDQLPVTCGLYFSLGHSTIVIVVNVAIAISSNIASKLDGVGQVGSIIGSAISGSFLFIVALMNSIILFKLMRRRRLRSQAANSDSADNVPYNPKENHMLMMRIIGPVVTFVNKPWKMYPVGLLFGLGFDTTSSIALLAVSALTKTSGGKAIPPSDVVILPFLFTAGMTLVDSLDSVLMLYSYAGFPEHSLRIFETSRMHRDSISELTHPDGDQIETKVDIPVGNEPQSEAEIQITKIAQVKQNAISGLSILLTLMSIMVALSISLIEIMALIGNNCTPCQTAAQAEDGGGLAGSWWRGWNVANNNIGYIGAGIVGAFVVLVGGWMFGLLSSQSTGAESSKDVAPVASTENAASSLRAAALLTLKSSKRRKVNPDQAQSSTLPIRPAAVDNSVQLDYGQDDAETDIASSPPEKPSLNQQPPPSIKIPEVDMEDGQVREEGEISDSEEVSPVIAAASVQSKTTTPSPTSNRPSPPKPSNNRHVPSSTFALKVETSSSSLLDRMSAVPPGPTSKSPQRVEVTNGEHTYFVDVDHVRPGLEMNQEQYDTAKDIVLDLLGWGVAPEYLVDCGLSREIVFYVFSELNLRLPQNLNTDGIIPYTPSTLETLLRVPTRVSSPLGSDSDTPRPLGHPSLPPKPSFPGQDRSRDSMPKPAESSGDTADVTVLLDMERQRRQELLARKAVQASRLTRSMGSISPTSKPMDVDDKDVEMTPSTSLAPSESVDDFLRSIEPVGSGKMDVDEVPGLASTSTPVLVEREKSIDRMVESPSSQTPLPTDEHLMSSVGASTSGEGSRRSSSSEDISGTSNGLARRNGKRPVAADFVDFDAAPRDRHGSGIKRSTGSFASISTMRRCVIDLSDSEGEADGEDVQIKPAAVPPGTTNSRYSTPPTSSAAAATPDFRTMSPAALAVKELEIQKMRQMIAEREQGRRMKLKLEAMSNPDSIPVKQEEEDLLSSLAIPVTQSPSMESSVTANTISSSAEIGNDITNTEGLNTPSIESQERSQDPKNNQVTIEIAERSPTAEAVDVDLPSSSSAQTTPYLSEHHPKPEEKALQQEKHEQLASSYISIFDSYPLLRFRPRPILQEGVGTIATHSSPSSASIITAHFLSPTSSFSSPSSFLSLLSLLSAIRMVRLATVSQLLDPHKRVCQYEIPGGGICKDSDCEDFHMHRMGGASRGLAIVEPSDQDIANYLSKALSESWITTYGDSLSSRIMTTLEDVRVNHPTITLEERVFRTKNWSRYGDASCFARISVRTLPIVTVQPTFPIVVNEVYSGILRLPQVPYTPKFALCSTMRTGRRSFTNLRIPPTRLLFPDQEYADPEKSNPQKPHRITAFSLAPDRSQYAIGYLDGSVLLYPSVPIQNSQSKYPTSAMSPPSESTYTYRRQVLISAASASSGLSPALIRAHKSTVTSLRFFPSSRVLLSSGADFTLQVYPADPIAAASVSSASGQSSKRVSSVRTLTAHTRSVTSSAMIGRGRAIISSSMDGTIRVWDVSTGEEETLVHSAAGVGIGINRIFLDSDRDLSSSEDAEPSSNSRLYAALHDGSFEVFALGGNQKPRKLVHEFRSEKSIYGALNAITVSMPTAEAREKFIAVGSAQGVISIYNASSYASVHFRRNEASIEDLDFVPLPQSKLGLVITTGDGLPWIASLDELPITGSVDAKVSVYAELVGGDVDAVRNVSVHTVSSTIEVWTASDDGIVRRYVL